MEADHSSSVLGAEAKDHEKELHASVIIFGTATLVFNVDRDVENTVRQSLTRYFKLVYVLTARSQFSHASV